MRVLSIGKRLKGAGSKSRRKKLKPLWSASVSCGTPPKPRERQDAGQNGQWVSVYDGFHSVFVSPAYSAFSSTDTHKRGCWTTGQPRSLDHRL